jgi:hypothetical protein
VSLVPAPVVRDAGDVPPSTTSRRERLAVLALLAVVGVVQCAGAFRGWHLLGANDWNWFLGQTEADVASLLRWHHFPLWAPWKHGGQPQFAQPEAMLLSPVTPVALLVGTLAAYKLLLLPAFLVGAFGTWRLAGRLGLSGLARLVPPLLLFGSSVFPLYLAGGLPNWLFALALLPWLVHALLDAPDDLRQALRAAVLLALVLFFGGLYPFAFLPVVLGLVALFDALARRSARPLLVLAAIGVCAFALASPRLLPLFRVYELYPRLHPGEDGFLTPALQWRAWASPALPDLSTPRGPVVFTEDTGIYWSYVGAYVGPLGLLLAAAGVLAARRSWRWTLLLAAMLWLTLGPWPALSAWNALHALPFYSSMRASERLMVFASFALALLGGFGWEALAGWSRRLLPRLAERPRRAAGVTALVLLVVPMLLVNAPIAEHAFTVEPTPGLQPGAFRQLPPVQHPEQWGGECFESVRANVGNPLGMSDIPSPPAVIAEGEPGYRGEVWLRSGGPVEATLAPGHIVVHCEPTADDVLVVNQNFFPGWKAEGTVNAPLVPYATDHNLLALPLPAGRHDLVLRYAPPEVPRALLLGGEALLVAGAYFLARRRGPVRRAGRPELLALSGFAVIAIFTGLPRPAVAPPRPPSVETRWLAGAVVLQPGEDEQAQLDRAPPGALVVLAPGRHPGLRIAHGLVLMAGPDGQAVVQGPLNAEALPAGERVALIGAEGRTLRLQGGLVAGANGTIELQSLTLTADAGPALAARGAKLQILDSAVQGPLELHGGAAHALDSTLSYALLRDGATLLLTRTPQPPLDADAASRALPEAPDTPRVSLLLSRFMKRSASIEIDGPPGAKGRLLLATRTALLEVPGLDGWLMGGVDGLAINVDVTLDAHGHARVRLRVPDGAQRPGAGLFAQFAFVQDGRPAISRPDGRLFALRDSPAEH